MKYITFKREMARAISEGRKSMTRRVVNSSDYRGVIKRGPCDGIEHIFRSPYGAPGDELILGTTWAVHKRLDNLKPTQLPDGFDLIKFGGIWSYFNSYEKPEWLGKLRPARFLPNKLRDRMPTVTLKDARIERVQNITEADAIKEGIFETPRDPGFECWSTHGMRDYYATPRRAFRNLWDKINAKRGYSWESNPWVWVLEW